ncbi:MAG: BatA domain-containing protein [Candidatus Aenigmarchaeota archaeon]|nr:BatA domain-containing protein [Candidatus Aenigmarchaeota archaeon]
MASILDQYFLNPYGLLGLLALIPLIIIYLKRPRPRKIAFPSIEFIMGARKRKSLFSFLSYFIQDYLFLLQVLIFIIFAAAMAYPYVSMKQSEAVSNAVIILDASASMQTIHKDNTGVEIDKRTRFERAKQTAVQNLADINTVILAADFPEALVTEADKGTATRLIQEARPKSTLTNLYDAMILGDDYLEGKQGKVVVISDFLHNANDRSLLTARSILESKGIAVEFRSLAGNASNAGIVDVKVEGKKVRIKVKNFNQKPLASTVAYGETSKTFNIDPLGLESIELDAREGASEISLLPEDDFMPDNRAYISMQQNASVRLLLITNNRSRFLYTALELLPGVKVDVAEPPVIPRLDYEIFILHNIEPGKLLPGAVKDIAEKVGKGAGVVIAAHRGMENIDYRELVDLQAKRVKKPLQAIRKESRLTEGMDFGRVGEYYDVSFPNTTELAYGNDGNRSAPLIAFAAKGSGTILYYGLDEASSSFHYELLYPVFWKRMIEQMAGKLDERQLNMKTGSILSLDGLKEVEYPDGSKSASKTLVLDQSGIYTIRPEGKKIAANLAQEMESAVSSAFASEESKKLLSPAAQEREAKVEMTHLAALLLLLLLFLELFILKYRGDV